MAVDPDDIPMYDDDLEGRAHRLAHEARFDVQTLLRVYADKVTACADDREIRVAMEALEKSLRVQELEKRLGEAQAEKLTRAQPQPQRPHYTLPRRPRRGS